MRRWSSIRTARRSVIATILIWAVLSVPNLLVYQIVNGSCRQTSLTYNDYAAFFLNPILYGFVPVSVLAIFGYATQMNVRHLANMGRREHGRVERQLTSAIILQCISFVISQVSVDKLDPQADGALLSRAFRRCPTHYGIYI